MIGINGLGIAVYFFYFILIGYNHAIEDERWAWSWKCHYGKCLRSSFPQLEKTLAVEEHEEVCKLKCNVNGLFWPKPTGSVMLSSEIIEIHPDKITFDLTRIALPPKQSSSEYSLIEKMADTFKKNIKTLCYNPHRSQHARPLHVRIRTSQSETSLNWQTDELYLLNITSFDSQNYTLVNIDSETIYGARHALQTTFQMLVTYSIGKQCQLIMPESGLVLDKPMYKHRGLLIDTSRHYLSVSIIKRIIDGMAQSKMNVLHWHATDSQSFPLYLTGSTFLARNGAFSPDHLYTEQNISDIVNYGLLNGVRVLMEIDGPSHAGFGWQSAIKGMNKVTCMNKQPYNLNCWEPPCGQLNPIETEVYDNLLQVYKVLMDLMKNEEVFHMGGDEVFIPCWRCEESIRDFLYRMGRNTTDEDFIFLWSEYQNRMLKMIDELDPSKRITAILWSSQLTSPTGGLDSLDNKRYVIQPWVERNNTIISELIQKGYRVIISTKDAWYLDHGFWGNTKYYQWTTVYDNILPYDTEMVLGGEVAMWGEYVDENVIEGRIWPRASAAAERLWTNPNIKAVEVEDRLIFHRQRLVKMGIKASPIVNQFCEQNPYECQKGKSSGPKGKN